MDLKTTIIVTIVAAITTFVCNGILEFLRNKNMRELSKQEMIWNLKAPIYMGLAEELENLIVDINSNTIDVKEQEKRFNKICNKIFLVGNDDIVKQLNAIRGGPGAIAEIGKVLIILRKELNKDTKLSFADYKRKTLSATEMKNN
jgi:hypothetical protein